ncbi:MAG: hypothetical protein U9N59_05995 [Campylobacterota bacterium]|nr:hypothetical protein [Campylobacterota bacterium]
MKKLSIALLGLGLVATSAFAGSAKGVIIDSDVKNASNIAVGALNTAEQNIHSLEVGQGGNVEYVYIRGKAQDVRNVAAGFGNKAKQNVGSVKVK